MPALAVLLVVAFFLVGLVILARPVTSARLDGFAKLHSIALTDTGRARLSAYLLARRRLRTAGVLVAAAIGLMISIPDSRVSFALVPMLAGWFIGAVAAEVSQRSAAHRVQLPYWWRFVPYATAGMAVAWTTAAVLLRSDGVDTQPLITWGTGALLASFATLAAVRYVTGHAVSDVDDEVKPPLAVSAARDLTSVGLALAVICLGRVWTISIPGPYEDADGQFPVAWVALVGVVIAWVIIQWTPASTKKLTWAWTAYAVVLALPIAWALPVRLAQEPPITPEQANATAQLRIATGSRVPDARAELGLDSAFQVTSSAGFRMLMGRVEVPPAPEGARWSLFAYNDQTNAPITDILGEHGASWYGGWSLDLPVRYPWLSSVMDRHSPQGYNIDPMAISPEGSMPLWFNGLLRADDDLSIENVKLVLMLTREDDSYIYWATLVPTTGKVLK